MNHAVETSSTHWTQAHIGVASASFEIVGLPPLRVQDHGHDGLQRAAVPSAHTGPS